MLDIGQVTVDSDQGNDLAAGLTELDRKWRAVAESPNEPRSTMAVIEYGLGKQRRAEVYVNRLLRYLLDPEEPHRMGTDFLVSFLQGLPDAAEFDEDTFDLARVRVDEQVRIENESASEASPGYADLVLDVPNEWVLLIELKFSAEETGTEFYSEASHIGGKSVESYESGQYYLYLHQYDRPRASSDEFVNWTWQSFIDDVLAPFIQEHALRFPQRTATQLHDLIHDLKSITGMSEHSTSEREKIALYLDHVDAIEDVCSAFDDAWEDYSEQWGTRLARAVIDDTNVESSQPGGRYPEVRVPRTDGDDERWILRANGGDWQHVFKYGWYRHEKDRELLTDRAEDSNDLRIGFYHRMEDNRETAVREKVLKFNFRNMGSNPSEFSNIYAAKFNDRIDSIDDLLAETNGTLTGNKLTLIEGTYPIPVNEHDDFFQAYTASLQNAFADLIVQRPLLISTLENVFEQSLDEFR